MELPLEKKRILSTNKDEMRLFVVGVGPGDPELIPLKSFKLFKEKKLIFYPTGGKESLALSIIEKLINTEEKTLIDLHFPMTKSKNLSEIWLSLSEKIYSYLLKEKEGIFVTLGDPAFYSTFYYVADLLTKKGIEIEVIPGITSFSLASACFKIPLTLGEEEALILPAEKFVKDYLFYKNFSTIILMKSHKHMKEILEFSQKFNYSLYLGKRLGQREEKMWFNPKEIPQEDLDYFSLVILQNRDMKGNKLRNE